MKTYCKDVDITDRDLVSRAVYDCLRHKWSRRDVVRLLEDYSGLSFANIRRRIREDRPSLKPIVEKVIDGVVQELKDRKLVFKPIHYVEKYDPCCKKVREIGVQDIKQQLFDYVAVYGLLPMLKRIGEYQCAAIKGRGQSFGVRAIRRWIRQKGSKYVAKMDVRQCFPSIDHTRLLCFIKRHVRNDALVWLITELVGTFRKGLSIGSFLSQYLCNLYISQIYHFAQERLFKYRRGKRIRLISHILIYMDDIVILGPDSKSLHKATAQIIEYTRSIGLEIKQDWRVWKIGNSFIDVMGVRIYRDHATIRRGVFVKLVRSFNRVDKVIRTRKPVPLWLARRALSYFGTLRNTNSWGVCTRLHVFRYLRILKKVISHANSSVHGTANCCDYQDLRVKEFYLPLS